MNDKLPAWEKESKKSKTIKGKPCKRKELGIPIVAITGRDDRLEKTRCQRLRTCEELEAMKRMPIQLYSFTANG